MSDPTQTEITAVRFEIGDFDPTAQMLTDEQIGTALETEGTRIPAAAWCLEAISRRFAMQADLSTGDLKLTYSKQAETLAARATELRTRAQGAHAPFAGGISAADKEARSEDEDREQGSFSRGQFDNPAAAIGNAFPYDDGEAPRP